MSGMYFSGTTQPPKNEFAQQVLHILLSDLIENGKDNMDIAIYDAIAKFYTTVIYTPQRMQEIMPVLPNIANQKPINDHDITIVLNTLETLYNLSIGIRMVLEAAYAELDLAYSNMQHHVANTEILKQTVIHSVLEKLIADGYFPEDGDVPQNWDVPYDDKLTDDRTKKARIDVSANLVSKNINDFPKILKRMYNFLNDERKTGLDIVFPVCCRIAASAKAPAGLTTLQERDYILAIMLVSPQLVKYMKQQRDEKDFNKFANERCDFYYQELCNYRSRGYSPRD